MEIDRTQPFRIEAEQAVLGAILDDPNRIGTITQLLKTEDFYIPKHQEIFTALKSMFQRSLKIDRVTLIDTLESMGAYNKEDGSRYIQEIIDVAPASSNVDDYVRIVKEQSTLRSLINAANEIIAHAYEPHESIEEALNFAESQIFGITNDNTTKDLIPIQEAISMTFKDLREIAQNPEVAAGTPTGFKYLDNVLVGMGRGDLIIVGARPGMGKTSFALNIATSVAKATKKAVAVFSLEMSVSQVVTRMLSSEAMIDSKKLRSAQLDESDWESITKVASELGETNILIDDSSGVTVSNIKSKLRKVKNLGLVIVDYLQLLTGEKHLDNRVLEVSDITRGLKLLAKELGVPIICCAQLSRDNEKRNKGDKRPVLSDLRDSGSIEQDADIVLFLYREEYYSSEPTAQDTAEIIVAKNRHGETGTVTMGWNGAFTKFINVDLNHEEP